MRDIRVNFGGTPAILTVSGDYKPGDPPPTENGGNDGL